MTCSMLWHLGLIYHKAHWRMWLKRAHPWYASLAPAMDRLSGEKLYQTRLHKIYRRYLQWRIHHIPPIGYQFIALCASQPQLATVTCPEKCIGRLQTPSHHSIDLLEVILSVPNFMGRCTSHDLVLVICMLHGIMFQEWAIFFGLASGIWSLSSGMSFTTLSSQAPSKAASKPLPRPRGNCFNLGWRAGIHRM